MQPRQRQPPVPLLLLHILLATVSASPLEPKQLIALQSLNISTTTKDPCSDHHNSSSSSFITCEAASPSRHNTSLSFTNCSSKTLKPLSKSLISLSFHNCPSLSPPHHLPISLRSFSAVSSFLRGRLSGIFLARLKNLETLEISLTPISTSNRLYVILGNMRKLTSLTISHANLSGNIPKSFHPKNLTHIDLSNNILEGSIRNSITRLSNLSSINLSNNSLSGQIPNNISDLTLLKNLSLASNRLSGPIPNSLSSISQLTHLDLSMNQLNGTVPSFFSKMKNLKYLNLAHNYFHGVLPFNESFIKKFEFFNTGGNSDLCYNKTVLSSELELGIAPCNRHGLPSSTSSGNDNDGQEGSETKKEKMMKKEEEHNGSHKTLFGIAIGLFLLVLLIIFLICLAKRWRYI